MKLNNIILIILISLSLSFCEFINSEYIKDLSSISEFDNQLINSNITMGMMLIYSTSCGHCHGFLPTYEAIMTDHDVLAGIRLAAIGETSFVFGAVVGIG